MKGGGWEEEGVKEKTKGKWHYAYIHVCMHFTALHNITYICMYANMYVRMYACIYYVCMYVRTYM